MLEPAATVLAAGRRHHKGRHDPRSALTPASLAAPREEAGATLEPAAHEGAEERHRHRRRRRWRAPSRPGGGMPRHARSGQERHGSAMERADPVTDDQD